MRARGISIIVALAGMLGTSALAQVPTTGNTERIEDRFKPIPKPESKPEQPLPHPTFVAPPDKEMYTAIFQQYAETNGFEFDPTRLDYVFRLYEADQRPLRACEPRDLLQRCADICRFENRTWALSDELLKLAWYNYFGNAPAA